MPASLIDDDEAQRIAAQLAAKYGADALAFVQSRAARALAVGDELAYSAWCSVRDATEAMRGAS
jgi:4-diphosphocytidyl-2C-methyl-D-erythritol kinase